MTRPDDLAAHAIAHVLAKAPALAANEIEEVILGCGQPHQSQGHNIARVAALRAGLPVSTAGLTVNRFCASGLQAIAQAAHMVSAEGADAIIAGGVESISMIQRDGSPNPVVKEQHPGVYMVMGETAEVVAKRYGVSRDRQDAYGLRSQRKTAEAQAREGPVVIIDCQAVTDQVAERLGPDAENLFVIAVWPFFDGVACRGEPLVGADEPDAAGEVPQLPQRGYVLDAHRSGRGLDAQ